MFRVQANLNCMNSKMYNLNVPSSGGDGNSLTLPQTGSPTPRTPEVLNTLMAMTNPFDGYNSRDPKLASSPPGNSDIGSSSASSINASSPTNPVSSVQRTRSLLIKEGLKLTIQAKRGSCSSQSSGSDPNADLSQDKAALFQRDEFTMDSVGSDDGDDALSSIAGDGMLTLEDEERRRRRRERNKIAATKCRLKKRERTVKLVQESEILENQNHDLKSEIQKLELERQQLVEMLSVHQTHCKKNQQISSYNDDDYASPSSDFATSDLASSSFQSGSKSLTSTIILHPAANYRKVSATRRHGGSSRKPPEPPSSISSEPSTSTQPNYLINNYTLEPSYSATEAGRRPDGAGGYCYPNSEPMSLNYHHFNSSDVKPPLSVASASESESPSYYDGNNTGYHNCQPGTNSNYNIQAYQPHQTSYLHSDYNDNNVELISPSNSAPPSFGEYSNNQSTNFTHFPIPCASPVDHYSQSDPRYNSCVYEINNS